MAESRSRGLAGLDAGFSLIELCALYFGRATLESLAGAPFHEELSRTFARFEHGLAPGMRAFLDRLPQVVGAKQTGGKRALTRHRERVTQLLEASVQCRKARMRYYSLTSGRAKDYDVDPLRVVYAEGGLYLIAHVAEYGEARTFAIERIESLTVKDERFTPSGRHRRARSHTRSARSRERRSEWRSSSIVGSAAYVTEREWHSEPAGASAARRRRAR